MSEDHNADEPSATSDSTGSVNRRCFVKALGAAGATTGLAGVGTAKKSDSETDHPDIQEMSVDTQASQAALNERAGPLLEALASKGLISEASASAFPEYALSTDEPGGIGRYQVGTDNREQLDFSKHTERGRLTINLPERGEPVAVFAPTDEATRDIYSSSTDYEAETQEVSTAGCGGCTCTQAPFCALKNFRKTVCEQFTGGKCRTVTNCGC